MSWITLALSCLLLAVPACGDSASVEDACANHCDCEARGGGLVDRPACLEECAQEAEDSRASDACLDCVAEASCTDLYDGTCAADCNN